MQEENIVTSNISKSLQENFPEVIKEEKHRKKFLIIKILVVLIFVYLFFDIVVKGLVVPKFLVSTTMYVSTKEQNSFVSKSFVYFTEVEGTLYLKYDGRVYPEKDTLSEELLEKHLSCIPSLSENAFNELNKGEVIEWEELVETLSGTRTDNPGCILDFEVSPSKDQFVFSMEWDNPETGNRSFSANYYTYYFEKEKTINCFQQADNVCVIYLTTVPPGEINYEGTPYVHSFSDNEEYVALTIRPCSNCGGGILTSTVLVRLSDQKTKDLGGTSYFSWKEDSAYEYKGLKVDEECIGEICLKDPSNEPLKTGEFDIAASLVRVDVNSLLHGSVLYETGNIEVPYDWKVVTVNREGEYPSKIIRVEKGDYSVSISTFGSGRAVCSGGHHKENLIEKGWIYFKDKDGTEYFREPLKADHDSLEICSNNMGEEGIKNEGFAAEEATFGKVYYNIPLNADERVVKELDTVISSYKSLDN